MHGGLGTGPGPSFHPDPQDVLVEGRCRYRSSICIIEVFRVPVGMEVPAPEETPVDNQISPDLPDAGLDDLFGKRVHGGGFAPEESVGKGRIPRTEKDQVPVQDFPGSDTVLEEKRPISEVRAEVVERCGRGQEFHVGRRNHRLPRIEGEDRVMTVQRDCQDSPATLPVPRGG